MSYSTGIEKTEAANARLREGYLRDQLERDQRRDQRIADREQRILGRTRHSSFTPPEQPERNSDQPSAERLAEEFKRRNAELRKQRSREQAEAIRKGKAKAAAAEERSYDQRSSAEKLLGMTGS